MQHHRLCIEKIVRRLHPRAIATGAVIIAAVTFGQPARASTNWSPDELAQLQAGSAVVRVTGAEGPADGDVRGAIDIPAPKSAVWVVLYDCAGAPSFMTSLVSCSVTEQGPGGAWDVREHQVQWTSFLPNVRSVFRSDYVNEKSITFKRAGGDLSFLEGEWRLEPLAGGKVTRIHYEARVGFNALVPGFLVRNALIKDIPKFLGVLRQEVLRRSKE
jgi:uncharacterized membrane protein